VARLGCTGDCLYEPRVVQADEEAAVITLSSDKKLTKAALAFMIAGLALAGCQKPPPVVFAPPPPPPVGHVYKTLVAVPPPPSRRIKITEAQQTDLQQAFNVIGLKSALMVGALSCGQQDQYDSFMRMYQPHILSDQHVLDTYFRRIDGRVGQTKEDAFVTLLANNQSVSGISTGPTFCLNNKAEFDAVLNMKSSTELDAFVTDDPPPISKFALPMAITKP
jgi:hypothetical protein